MAATTFAGLGLDKWLVDACSLMGFKVPTTIQKECVPEILKGRNVIGSARTGSGKTAAFALPILQDLSRDPFGVHTIVLTPTRELAFQIADQFNAFGSGVSVRVCVVVGGVDLRRQQLELASGPHVIVATPGRLREHMSSANAPAVSHARFLVLDECDRLLGGSFERELAEIASRLPRKRQTLLFSATMTASVADFARAGIEAAGPMVNGKVQGKKGAAGGSGDGGAGNAAPFVCDANEIDNPGKHSALPILTPDTLSQSLIFTPPQAKDAYLFHLLDTIKPESAIIFCATCKGAQTVSDTLALLGLTSTPLHSVLPQGLRLASLARFRSLQAPILVATDVASRGLDIPTVSLVVHYDIPRDPTDYAHRSGRTARAGRAGHSVAMVTQHDVGRIHAIEDMIGVKLKAEVEGVTEKGALEVLSRVTRAARGAKVRLSEIDFGERREKQKKQKRDREGGDDTGKKRGRNDNTDKKKKAKK